MHPSSANDHVAAAITTDFDEVGGLLVATLEDCYNAVRKDHPEVPAAVIVISSSPRRGDRQVMGHFAHSRWEVNGTKMPEIMISAEGLKRHPRDVLATLVHEAAHGLCHVRGIEDTTTRGYYHNEKFKFAAEELGMVVEKEPFRGYNITTVPQGKYDDLVGELTKDLIGYRSTEVGVAHQNGKRRTEFSYRCSCPRTIRVHEGESFRCG